MYKLSTVKILLKDWVICVIEMRAQKIALQTILKRLLLCLKYFCLHIEIVHSRRIKTMKPLRSRYDVINRRTTLRKVSEDSTSITMNIIIMTMTLPQLPSRWNKAVTPIPGLGTMIGSSTRGPSNSGVFSRLGRFNLRLRLFNI